MFVLQVCTFCIAVVLPRLIIATYHPVLRPALRLGPIYSTLAVGVSSFVDQKFHKVIDYSIEW